MTKVSFTDHILMKSKSLLKGKFCFQHWQNFSSMLQVKLLIPLHAVNVLAKVNTYKCDKTVLNNSIISQYEWEAPIKLDRVWRSRLRNKASFFFFLSKQRRQNLEGFKKCIFILSEKMVGLIHNEIFFFYNIRIDGLL